MSRALAAVFLVGFALLACGTGPADPDAPDAPDAPTRIDAGVESTVVPIESSDAELLTVLGSLDALPTLGTPRLAQFSSEDQSLGGFVPTTLLARDNRDMNQFVCLGEGSDVRDGLVPHRYELPACPEPWVRGAVLARVEGAGAMVRLWSTIFSARTLPPDRERLLVWVDDAREPIVNVPLAAALDGTAGAIFAPPFGAGRSDRLAWTYPVVFSTRLIVALDHIGVNDLVYHQTTVRMDPAGTMRVAGASVLPERERAGADLEATPTGALSPTVAAVTLAAGETRAALSLTGPATIRALRVQTATDRAALAPVSIRIAWDGSATPAVEVSLLELFAAWSETPPTTGLVRGMAAAGGGLALSLHLPMPFAVAATVTLANTGTVPVTLTIEAETDAGVPAAPFGMLAVQRFETVGPTVDPSHPLAMATGPGRLVGVCLMLEGRALAGAGAAFEDPLNFLEGDETFLVDGTTSLVGTGTEDYLDGAFYFERGPHVTPFAQAWGVGSDAGTGIGHASACRWHVRTTAIDFASSLDATLEIGPGDSSTLVRYRSIAFLYR